MNYQQYSPVASISNSRPIVGRAVHVDIKLIVAYKICLENTNSRPMGRCLIRETLAVRLPNRGRGRAAAIARVVSLDSRHV